MVMRTRSLMVGNHRSRKGFFSHKQLYALFQPQLLAAVQVGVVG